jgi:uncharacterized protein (TIGR02453 family)
MAKTKAAPKRETSPAKQKTPAKQAAAKKASTEKGTAKKAPAKKTAAKAAPAKKVNVEKTPRKAAKTAPTKAAPAKKVPAKTVDVEKTPKKTAKTAPVKRAAEQSLPSVAAGAGAFAGFPADLFQFLAELGLNNEREWFEPRKQRYESSVLEPALAFIRAMGPQLPRISSAFVAIDKKVGGSLMRVHRDVRFSKDKTPYKTNVGIQFRHATGKDVHAPGLYVHLEPGGCFLGVGLWHPEPDALARIRARIVEEADVWQRVRDDAGFRAVYALQGESLARPPRGVDPAHPHVEDLKRKDHIAVASLPVSAVTGPTAVEEVARRLVAGRDYVRFLCEAVGVAF